MKVAYGINPHLLDYSRDEKRSVKSHFQIKKISLRGYFNAESRRKNSLKIVNQFRVFEQDIMCVEIWKHVLTTLNGD